MYRRQGGALLGVLVAGSRHVGRVAGHVGRRVQGRAELLRATAGEPCLVQGALYTAASGHCASPRADPPLSPLGSPHPAAQSLTQPSPSRSVIHAALTQPPSPSRSPYPAAQSLTQPSPSRSVSYAALTQPLSPLRGPYPAAQSLTQPLSSRSVPWAALNQPPSPFECGPGRGCGPTRSRATW